MLIVGFFSWWYGAGLVTLWRRITARLAAVYDYFSIDLLLRTWFSPFRQISAGKVNGPIGVKFHAFLDRLVSRIIGGVVRTLVMLIGVVTLGVTAIVLGVWALAWLLMPAMPLLGLIAWLSGGVPWM